VESAGATPDSTQPRARNISSNVEVNALPYKLRRTVLPEPLEM